MNIINISKQYNKKMILDNVSLDIDEGDFFIILGDSGSGKTTLLKIIAGIEKQNSGEIRLDNKNLGYVFQEPLLFPNLNVKENVTFALTAKGVSKSEINKKYSRLEEKLELEGLENRMSTELSGGQRQRVSIARTLANEPQFLLMDEPFSSLDKNLRIKMGEFIKKIQVEFNLTIIFVTHDIDEAVTLGDKIAFLNDGQIIECGSAKDIYLRAKNEITAKFMGEYTPVDGVIIDDKFSCEFGEFDAKRLNQDVTRIFIRPDKINITLDVNGGFIIEKTEDFGKYYKITLKDNDLKIYRQTLCNLKADDIVSLCFEI